MQPTPNAQITGPRAQPGMRRSALFAVLLLAILGLAAAGSVRLLSLEAVADKDRLQTLFAAYSLAVYGVMDYSERKESAEPDALSPGNRREPLYPLLWSALIAMDPGGEIAAHGWSCFRVANLCPATAWATKSVNLVLYLGVAATVGWGLFALTGSAVWGLAGAAAAAASPILVTGVADWYTETGANLFLLLHSLLLYAAFRARRARAAAVLAGIALGLLILVKAAFYYLWLLYGAAALGALAVGLVLAASRNNTRVRAGAGTAAAGLGIIFACAFLVIGPWMLRNLLVQGDFAITERGDEVLTIRAEYTTMPWSDFPPALAYFTPGEGKQLLARYFDAQTVARLDRNSPESYYRKAKTGRSAAHAMARARNISVGDAAIQVIAGNLDKQIALIPVFAYRGSVAPHSQSAAAYERLSGRQRSAFRALQLAAFPLLLLGAAWLAISGPRRYLILFVPLGFSVAFHAGLTHFIARYALPQYGVSLLLLLFLAFLVAARTRRALDGSR